MFIKTVSNQLINVNWITSLRLFKSEINNKAEILARVYSNSFEQTVWYGNIDDAEYKYSKLVSYLNDNNHTVISLLD